MTLSKAARRSRISGPKVSYREWQRFRRVAQWLRRRHFRSYDQMSRAMGQDPGYMASAMKYRYQVKPYDYEQIRKLLKERTQTMPLEGTKVGARLSADETNILRRLVKTVRSRGTSVNQLAIQSGLSSGSIANWLNDSQRCATERTRDSIVSWITAHLSDGRELIQEAFGNGAPAAAVEPAPPPRRSRRRKTTTDDLNSRFSVILRTIQEAEAELNRIASELPPFLGDLLNAEVTQWISQGREKLEASMRRPGQGA